MEKIDKRYLLETPDILGKSIQISFWVGLVVAVLVFLGFMCHLLTPTNPEHVTKTILLMPCLLGALAGLITLGFSRATLDDKTTTVCKNTLVITRRGELVLHIQENTIFWKGRWEKFCEGLFVEKFEEYKVEVSMTCTLIKPDQKVREIQYLVNVNPFSTVNGFVEQRRRFGAGSAPEISESVGKTIERMLYDFNDHSKELAEFSNPLRTEQQEKFQKMIFDYLRPFAEKNGIELESASFSL